MAELCVQGQRAIRKAGESNYDNDNKGLSRQGATVSRNKVEYFKNFGMYT